MYLPYKDLEISKKNQVDSTQTGKNKIPMLLFVMKI